VIKSIRLLVFVSQAAVHVHSIPCITVFMTHKKLALLIKSNQIKSNQNFNSLSPFALTYTV